MTADTVGGVWAYALDLARGLAAHGVCVDLATMGPPLDDDQWAEARAISGLSVHESTFALEWMQDPWQDVELAGEWLTWLEQRLCPDIVHLNGYALATLPWACPVVVGAHSCVASWWRAVRGTPPPREYARYLEAVAAGVACADVVVAPSAAMLGWVHDLHGRPSSARVIPNGIWTQGPLAASKDTLVLAAGRTWDEGKNLALLERVAARLGHPVHIAGAQGQSDEPRHPHVVHLGRLGRRVLRATMARAAIFAHPSRYEPFGLAPLEAADAGCALVLADLPSLREVWGEAADYVAPDDERGWVQALGELASDPHRRRRQARKAWRRTRELNARRMTERYLSLYAELADSRIHVRHSGGAP
jgi:glycogen synthase